MACEHRERYREFGNKLGERIPVAIDRHDCAYVDERNRLIPQAELAAIRVAGKEPDALPEDASATEKRQRAAERHSWGEAFNKVFHAEMERLWAQRQKPN